MPVHALDNIVWHSLLGPRRALGTVGRRAGRFDRDVAPFGAVSDEPGTQDWDELAEILGPHHATVLFRPPLDVPSSWSVEGRIPTIQMMSAGAKGVDDPDLVPLVTGDVPEMLELIARTQPGPFSPRTIEFGGYIGIRHEGRLVAMAGERLSGGGFTEISAVCTDAEHRGRGYGTKFVLALVHRIRERGEEAFLHVATNNENAIRLYLALGFEIRREVEAVIVRSPSEG
jgi:ribosomal protein S18 acetylase RimI-like enzyme